MKLIRWTLSVFIILVSVVVSVGAGMIYFSH